MLIKNILIGMLVSLFCLGLVGTVIAGGYGTPNVYLDDKDSSDTMEKDGIEFDYSPMTVSSGFASASSRNNDIEVIEFDYSPRKSNNLASGPSMNKDSEDIEFDYTPRSVNCGTPYC
jgi:hypothetical protein